MTAATAESILLVPNLHWYSDPGRTIDFATVGQGFKARCNRQINKILEGEKVRIKKGQNEGKQRQEQYDNTRRITHAL